MKLQECIDCCAVTKPAVLWICNLPLDTTLQVDIKTSKFNMAHTCHKDSFDSLVVDYASLCRKIVQHWQKASPLLCPKYFFEQFEIEAWKLVSFKGTVKQVTSSPNWKEMETINWSKVLDNIKIGCLSREKQQTQTILVECDTELKCLESVLFEGSWSTLESLADFIIIRYRNFLTFTWIRLLKLDALNEFKQPCNQITCPKAYLEVLKWCPPKINGTILSFGSSMGNLRKNINQAIKHLGLPVKSSSSLYISENSYKKVLCNSPTSNADVSTLFLNAVVAIDTRTSGFNSPKKLLDHCRLVEGSSGRIRSDQGENLIELRTVDIDILQFEDESYNIEMNDILVLPHKRMLQRDFVLRPLWDLAENYYMKRFGVVQKINYKVSPISHSFLNESHYCLMGVINLSPESFLGPDCLECAPNLEAKVKIRALDNFIKCNKKAIESKRIIFDIGGQSSAPDSIVLSSEEEIERIEKHVDFLINFYRKDISAQGVVSVDTFKPDVVDYILKKYDNNLILINDISGGLLSWQKYKIFEILSHHPETVYVLTHSVGMKILNGRLKHKNITTTNHYRILGEIQFLQRTCLDRGIFRWNIVTDPGFGFGKSFFNEIMLLRKIFSLWSNHSLMLGFSRKTFVKKFFGPLDTHDKEQLSRIDSAMIGCTVKLLHVCMSDDNSSCILRCHEVKRMDDALCCAQTLHLQSNQDLFKQILQIFN